MDTQPESSRWRSRKVWLGGLAALAVCVAASPLSGGGCEGLVYPDGTILPLSFPWKPLTREGLVLAQRVVTLASVVAPLGALVAVSLLLGALWARVLRNTRWVLPLVLVPSLGGALLLLQEVLMRTYTAAPSEWVFRLTWEWLPSLREFVLQGALALLGLGLLVLLWRKVQGLRSRVTA